MANIERIVIVALVAASLISVASAIAGTATFYGPPYLPSACYGFQDQGTMIAAANPSLYNNGAACGRMYRVRCTGSTNSIPACTGNNEITVKIVDLCPACQNGQLDLAQDAFAIIANRDAGRIRIDYTQV